MITEPADTIKDKICAHTEIVRSFIFITVAILLAYAITLTIGVEQMRTAVESAGVYGPIVAVLLKMSTIIIVPLSGGPLYAIAGAMFGFWEGMMITFIGDILGFSLAFFISRLWGGSAIKYFVPKSLLPKINEILIRGSELRPFIKARIAFIAPSEIFAYAAGLSVVSYRKFILVQMIPHVPLTTVIVLFGDGLITGNPVYFAAIILLNVSIMITGAWWFYSDIKRKA